MDNLVSLLKAYGGAAVNEEVKAKILELIQIWATATEGQYELSYIGETYKSLQRDGFHFPPKVDVAKSMLLSNAVSEQVGTLSLRTNTAESLPNGQTPMYACDAEHPLVLRTESTIAETVGMSSINNVRPKCSPCHILGFFSL